MRFPYKIKDSRPTQKNFDYLIRWLKDDSDALGFSIGPIKVRFGTVVCTWPGGSQQTNAPVVTHGLGKTPIAVLTTVISTPVNAWNWVNTVGATTFLTSTQTAAAAPALGTTATVAWLAIG